MAFHENGRGIFVHVWFDPNEVTRETRNQAEEFIDSIHAQGFPSRECGGDYGVENLEGFEGAAGLSCREAAQLWSDWLVPPEKPTRYAKTGSANDVRITRASRAGWPSGSSSTARRASGPHPGGWIERADRFTCRIRDFSPRSSPSLYVDCLDTDRGASGPQIHVQVRVRTMARRRNILVLVGIAGLVAAILLLIRIGSDDAGGRDQAGGVCTARRMDRLPLPPAVRDGASFQPTDDRLLLFGGCGLHPRYRCPATTSGFSYSPATDEWTRMPKAPFGPMGASVWTGDEAIFLNTGTNYKPAGKPRPIRALAFDPVDESWRRLPPAPLRVKNSDAIWTGSEVIVWGGGGHSAPAADGVAYDPATGSWHKIPQAPIALNNVNLAWTGSEMIAFGSRLDVGNHASTRVAVGVAYDPATNSWRRIADSKLSPRPKPRAGLAGAWSPTTTARTTSSTTPRLTAGRRSSRCRCASASVTPTAPRSSTARSQTSAARSPHTTQGRGSGARSRGGMTRRLLAGYQVHFWGQASLATLGGSAYLLATGYSQGGGKGQIDFPRSFWSYTPPPASGRACLLRADAERRADARRPSICRSLVRHRKRNRLRHHPPLRRSTQRAGLRRGGRRRLQDEAEADSRREERRRLTRAPSPGPDCFKRVRSM